MAKRKNNPLCRVGTVESVDMETGETVPVEGGGMYMLPNAPGTCDWCAVKHDPDQPHNQQSLYWQMKFRAIKGRDPTWTDAMAHCSEEVKEFWRRELVVTMKKNGMEIPEDLR